MGEPLAATLTSDTWTVEEVRQRVRDTLKNDLVSRFHRLWYDTPTTWPMTRYRGISMLKSPFDLQVYHEIIHEVQPALIIETGTAFGGSALWFADQMSMTLQRPNVITIDVENNAAFLDGVDHINRFLGSSTDSFIVRMVQAAAASMIGPILVSLDSDHAKDHVASELEAYGELVTPGSYLVVEDTNIGGHPIPIGPQDGGPGAAVKDWLPAHPDFAPEICCERYLLTMHPGGWLRRAA